MTGKLDAFEWRIPVNEREHGKDRVTEALQDWVAIGGVLDEPLPNTPVKSHHANGAAEHIDAPVPKGLRQAIVKVTPVASIDIDEETRPDDPGADEPEFDDDVQVTKKTAGAA